MSLEDSSWFEELAFKVMLAEFPAFRHATPTSLFANRESPVVAGLDDLLEK